MLTINCWDVSLRPRCGNHGQRQRHVFGRSARRSSSTPQALLPHGVAGASEHESNSLPAMRFFTSGLANGTFSLRRPLHAGPVATCATSGATRRGDTKHYFIDTVGGSGGATQHTEYRLGSVTVTDGSFSLYAQDADLLSGAYPVFGWAWIRWCRWAPTSPLPRSRR